MKNGMIHIVRPIDSAAEKEYIKEFFRFIGCFIYDQAVDEGNPSEWDQLLQSSNEENGIDIILNHYGSDPYLSDCQQLDIKRIYCYFDFDKGTDAVSSTPLTLADVPKEAKPLSKATLREEMIQKLIKEIWVDEPDICRNILTLAGIYMNNRQGDLFFLLQAKRCFRVLGMGEVLREPSAQVARIPLSDYIKRILNGLWELRVRLKESSDAYSAYARVNAAIMMREIVYKLYDSDRAQLNAINYAGESFRLFTVRELVQELRNLIEADSQFVSAYLLMASLCKSYSDPDRDEEACYLQALRSVPNSKKGYAFIWYRIGYFYEKKLFKTERALEYYQKAVQLDPNFYQALFKLSYYAAADGRFNEAESLLNRMIQAIFHGRSTEPNINGEYENWLALSLKDSQYVYKAYILLARIAINSEREYSARAFVGKACLAATRFEEAGLVRYAADSSDIVFDRFISYHKSSTPVWSIWQVLRPWSEDIIQDSFVRNIVRDRLTRWR